MPGKKIKVLTKTNVQKSGWKWVASIIIFAFVVTMMLGYVSNETIPNVSLTTAFCLLALFVLIGIIFDMIGIAVASGDEKPFHSMAAHKVRGARQAVWLIRNAEKVSNFCNDVIGDIAGIISGVTTGVIMARLASDGDLYASLLITSIVSALTIGGKALSKGFSITNSNQIVYSVGLCLSFLGVARRRR